MADIGQRIAVGLGGGKPAVTTTPAKPPKVAAAHVENFSEANLGKKVPLPKRTRIAGQTFRD